MREAVSTMGRSPRKSDSVSVAALACADSTSAPITLMRVLRIAFMIVITAALEPLRILTLQENLVSEGNIVFQVIKSAACRGFGRCI